MGYDALSVKAIWAQEELILRHTHCSFYELLGEQWFI